MVLKNRVKQYRQKAGLSATQLAKEAKIAGSALWRIEKDAENTAPETRLGTCFAIAKALGRSISDLFFLE